MESLLHNEKVKLILKVVFIALGLYVVFVFGLPLIWPVVVGYIIAKINYPIVNFLNKKVQFHKTVATILVLAAFITIAGVAGVYLGKVLISQMKNLMSNWNVIMLEIDSYVKNVCGGVEKGLNLVDGALYTVVSDGFSTCLETGRKKMFSLIMNNSVTAFMKMIELVIAVIVIIMTAYFFVKDKEKIDRWFATYPFARETAFISEKIKFVFSAYIKAQAVIMLFSTVICFAAFSFIKNPYSLILAIVVGLLDALPMIGIGVILIPWGVILLISGSAKNGIVLILTFVICYTLREILEPKLIGGKVGMSPIASLIAIYVGYRLLGIIGVVLGPVAYVVLKESVRIKEKNEG